MLAVWALLLCRTELAECFCAYTPEPTAFSLILAKVAKNLAAKVSAKRYLVILFARNTHFFALFIVS